MSPYIYNICSPLCRLEDFNPSLLCLIKQGVPLWKILIHCGKIFVFQRQCIENEEEKKREEEKKKKREEEEAKKKAPVFVCPVCQEQFVHATSTICGHIFCEDCIKKSIRIQKKCPTCRRKLTSRKNQIHRVYLPLAEES